MQRIYASKKLISRAFALIVSLVVLGAGCSLPFEWAGSMPTSWAGGSESGEEADGSSDDTPQESGSPADDPGDTGGSPPAASVMPLSVSGPSFTLAWDSGSGDVSEYNVYWRAYGETDWRILAVGVTDAQYTVTDTQLPYGSYEFAVSSLDTSGTESNLHHSYDDTADPEPWYLEWTA
jgi:hypothetical protein